MNKIIILIGLVLTLIACNNGAVYDKYEPIPDYQWEYSNLLTFEVNLDDKSSAYDLFINLRHADFYPYNNLWIILHIKSPDSESFTQERIQISLAAQDGTWFGDCMGDICDVQIPIKKNISFPEKGVYTFKLEQNMRQDPLIGIMETGIKIKKAEMPN